MIGFISAVKISFENPRFVQEFFFEKRLLLFPGMDTSQYEGSRRC